MGRAKSVSELLATKVETFPFKDEWYDAFGEPERKGVWLVWGNSGNGKTTFVVQLCKYLCQFERCQSDDEKYIGEVRNAGGEPSVSSSGQ